MAERVLERCFRLGIAGGIRSCRRSVSEYRKINGLKYKR
jgi:hypothetical protein